MSEENPLLKESTLSRQATHFDLIKTKHFIPALEKTIESTLNDLSSLDEKTPKDLNFLEKWDKISLQAEMISSIYFNLFSANADDEFQKLANKISPMLAKFSNAIYLNQNLFKRIKSIYNKKSELDDESSRLAEKIYLEFVRNGAQLNEQEKETLRSIDEEMATLSPEFSKNLLSATMDFYLHITNENELNGIPQEIIQQAHLNAKEKNLKGYVFTLQIPSYKPFMSYAKDRKLREKMYRAYSSRCARGKYSNQNIIQKLTHLRKERANLLGYTNHASYVLEDRMAETPQKVIHFLDQLYEASWDTAKEELKALQELASEIGIKKVEPWDVLFLMEILKEKTLSFNDEKLKPYFEINQVLNGLFKIANNLYQLEFSKIEVPVYHPDVEVFEINDDQGYLGLLYIDLFTRATKKPGAWMTVYKEQYDQNRPHISICCNFAPPTNNQAVLLTLDEVRTIFHEFGHALHGLLSQTHYKSLSGTNVYWDFVELPSQIMENWVNEKEALAIFARHYKTGEAIPENWIDQIKEESKFMTGYNTIRQLNFAYLDMAYHTITQSIDIDLNIFEKEATSKTSLFNDIEGTLLSTAFDHIFSGSYSAGYYSYKWAEVLDADAFEEFKEKGIFNKKTAKSFKENILSRGNTANPMDLYIAFKNKKPAINALLIRNGLLKNIN